jgi:hypothetical protein
MRQLLITPFFILAATIQLVTAQTRELDISKVQAFEHQLQDVMEITDTIELKIKLVEVEENFRQNPNEITKTWLGIIYHETALNLAFFSKTKFKSYSQKSYDILSALLNSNNTTKELLPFIATYRASALALVSAETRKLKLLDEAFELFSEANRNYASVSYLPEFLRGSVAENLPWIFYSKRKFAGIDFQSIINKQKKNPEYAGWKIMSFTYWTWANQHQDKKHRTQAIAYLNQAILLDPDYKAGRKKAEELKARLTE